MGTYLLHAFHGSRSHSVEQVDEEFSLNYLLFMTFVKIHLINFNSLEELLIITS